MTTIYTYDSRGIYSGAVPVENPKAPVPAGLLTAPPALTGTQVAQAVGNAWVVLPEYPPVPPAPAPTVADFDAALTAHLDATAQARRYDNRITCMVRAGFPGPFQAEGQAFATWCDTCNAMAYTLLANVQVGTRPLPATTQALIDTLPPMVWPD